MKIAIPKERRENERRVAISPETVKKMVDYGLEVIVESDAGKAASYLDDAYKKAGASIAKEARTLIPKADVVLKVQRPMTKDDGGEDELQHYKQGQALIATMDAYKNRETMEAIAKAGLTAFAMEFMPRITRAQSMDVLSSQANLAGYKAVLDAAEHFGKAFPMMMTAAGTIPPAKAFIMGAGVAGLQAIATARRLGAQVSATDVRPAAKEQVESLGGKFVAVEDEEFKEAEAAGGYAKEMSDEYKEKQAELIAETIKKQDIVITTALIPGKPAPKLVSADMVKSMKAGSVIVDLAVENGGNCELSEPGEVVTTDNGVTIVGHLNVPGRLAADTSALYGRNVWSFLQLLVDKESKELKPDFEDQIVKDTCVTRDGEVVSEKLKSEGG
ncbi:MAG: Re/Si-specific NAD(P)(+) transhydrogenase subunit alpha [Rhodovibrionaceae bacterium]|nr:Re/Si-specific NAD(P)(+) transhydrogenase subunit alpha [Rhodovibrionaceae bacterium]